MKHFVRVLGIGLLLSFSTHVHAYEAISVTNGGSISGKVLLEGKEPPALAYSIVTNNDTEFCGRISTGTGWRIVDEFQVAPDGGLENVVVFLEDIQKANRLLKKVHQSLGGRLRLQTLVNSRQRSTTHSYHQYGPNHS